MAVLFGARIVRLLLSISMPMSLLPMALGAVADPVPPDHLVVSEVVTGGASASDELIELFNPTPLELPLEGLELVYASATGTTVSRRAAWELGAATIPPGGHVLIANAAGMFAPIADATYTQGLAAAGGSVALRIQGASTAIDAVGWGTAASAWLEGTPAPASAAGASLERLPGGILGSTQDTDDNAADFVERAVPEPQNSGSPLIPPGVTPTPMPSEIVTPTPEASLEPSDTPAIEPTLEPTIEPTPEQTPIDTPAPTPVPTATPAPAEVASIASARTQPDGTSLTIEAVALTASGFQDGGGFVADATGALAVLVSDGTFARGELLRITGEIGDRFSQRTLRADATGIIVLRTGVEPTPMGATTGGVGEELEGHLVSLAGAIVGSSTTLANGLAFDLDDGTGVARLIVGSGLGIDTGGWRSGMRLSLVGVVGQRDSSGTGTAGYRVMPRDAADIIQVESPSTLPPSNSAAPVASASTSPTPGASDDVGIVSIADARDAPRGARLVVSGVVTLPAGVVDSTTAVVADATGGIVLRLSVGLGRLALGERIEVEGTRSTRSGMQTLRVSEPPRRLGFTTAPAPLELRTGDVGEAHEAQLVVVRGALLHAARRSSTGSISFDIDDGSGSLKVVLGASLRAGAVGLTAGTWVEVSGVLGQQTTGARPASGYRLWPAKRDAVRLLAQPTTGAEQDPAGGDPAPTPGSFDDFEADGGTVRVGATLVAGPWPELGIGGLLWDGQRLAAIDADSAGIVNAVIAQGAPPIALDLGNLLVVGTEPATGIDLMALGRGPTDVVPRAAEPQRPVRIGTAGPAWVTVVGRLVGRVDRLDLLVRGGRIRVDRRCSASDELERGLVVLTGIALPDPLRLVVACNGLRPVPALRHVTVDSPAGRGHAAPPGPTEITGVPRGLAVGGLLTASALLAGAAALMRLRRRGDPGGSVAAGIGHPAGPSEVDVPSLTLVHVAREHRS